MVSAKVQEQWVDAVKSIGQSLIDNADEIAGHYDYQTCVDIMVTLEPNQPVEVSINSRYLPKSITTGLPCVPMAEDSN